jgi:E3 ubiquitin-protein ligase UBR1
VEHVLRVASRLSHIDLGVTVRRASDTFREEICSVLIEWLVDLTRSLINETDALTLREIVAARLFESRNKPGSLAVTARLPSKNPSRLEWLFFYHTRLWKRPRLNLKDLYITILNISHSHKVEMGKLDEYISLPRSK